jgi:hypothetical protein
LCIKSTVHFCTKKNMPIPEPCFLACKVHAPGGRCWKIVEEMMVLAT